MRKSVIFTISIIYALSIFVVTLFGMKMKVDQFVIYMDKLEITSYDKISVKGIKQKTVYLGENDEYVAFQLEYEYTPDNATYPDKIEFLLKDEVKTRNGEEITIATITSFGKVVFTAIGTVTVKVYAGDGSVLEDVIQISCRNTPTTQQS